MPFHKQIRYWVLMISIFYLPIFSHAQRIPPVTVVDTYETENATINVYFEQLKQGRVGLISVEGNDITNADISVFGLQTPTFIHDGNAYAFVSVPMEQAIRTYEAQANITYSDGSEETHSFPVEVISGGFIQQNVFLPLAGEDILNPEIERDELAMIFETASVVTPEALWDDAGFIIPRGREFTSPFGAVRVFNGNYETLHTGWDYGAGIGENMHALASGRVAFAGPLPIRGNYVLINHGQGLYTGYAHLSVTFVTQGQSLTAGQIIGRVGSTGRSSSAHAHIEMIANGGWVDVADFLALYMPRLDQDESSQTEND